MVSSLDNIDRADLRMGIDRRASPPMLAPTNVQSQAGMIRTRWIEGGVMK